MEGESQRRKYETKKTPRGLAGRSQIRNFRELFEQKAQCEEEKEIFGICVHQKQQNDCVVDKEKRELLSEANVWSTEYQKV